MVYANASAFYGMNAFGDRKSHEAHFAGRLGANPWLKGSDQVAEANNDTGKVIITGMGYAMGHYARWLKRGAARIEATSDDSLLQVIAFRDDARKRLVLVIINNAAESRALKVALSALSVKGPVTGEQSTAHNYWKKIEAFAPAGDKQLSIELPALSVTTLSAPFAEP
jgi:O-glycosyl hydrolase